MNLFQTISDLLSENSSISIKIRKIKIDGYNKLNVMVIPEINTENLKIEHKRLTPILIKGKPSELDEEFIDKIKEPLFKVSVTAQSIAQLEEDLSAMTKSAKSQVTKTKKSQAPSKTTTKKDSSNEQTELKSDPEEKKEPSKEKESKQEDTELKEKIKKANEPKKNDFFDSDESEPAPKEEPKEKEKVSAFEGNVDNLGTKKENDEPVKEKEKEMSNPESSDDEDDIKFF